MVPRNALRFSDQMILTLLGPYGAVEVAQPEKEIADLPSDPYLERHAWVVRKNRKIVVRAMSNAVFNTEGSYPQHPDYYWLSIAPSAH